MVDTSLKVSSPKQSHDELRLKHITPEDHNSFLTRKLGKFSLKRQHLNSDIQSKVI